MRNQQMQPSDLRVGFREDPTGVRDEPRFSWRVHTGRAGTRQRAYQLLVTDDEETIEAVGNTEGPDRDPIAEGATDLRDSGRVDSPRSIDVPYEGPPLSPDTTYFWRVRVWGESDTPSEFSAPAQFTTAPDTVRGEWISHAPDGGDIEGYRSEWHAPDSDATEWVQVDLGESRSIEEVTLVPAAPFSGFETPDGLTVSPIFARGVDDSLVAHPSSRVDGFGFPESFRVELSEDPDFESVSASKAITDAENPGSSPVPITVEGEGRYVRVTATDLYVVDPSDCQRKLDIDREEFSAYAAFALAELRVSDGTGNLAAGAPASASSTLETPTWTVDALTDGRDSEMACSSPWFRRRVTIDREPVSARFHVSGLGYGEVHVNGERVGDDVLNPAWTQFDERVLYESYDLSDDLAVGENVIGLWLGRGWFSKGFFDWTGFGSPRVLGHLRLEFGDGSTRTITTGPDWGAADSPILENDIYDGETFDARSYDDDWAAPAGMARSDSVDTASDGETDEWTNATVVPGPGGRLLPQQVEPMRVVDELDPIEIREHPDGPIVDFGQNFTGWVEIEIDDPDPGQAIEIQHAETLTDDGDLSTIDLRSADATDTYVARGDDLEGYEPRFTYHGFRYAQVRNYPGSLTRDDLTAKAVHTAMEPTGSFECSNGTLEDVQEASEWGLLSNSHAVPTDCPQRDERFGWTGDGRLTARAFQYNFESVRFHRKWLADHRDAQSEHGYVPDTIPYGFGTIPGDVNWSLTMTLVPWTLYQQFGDRDVLERHFEAMCRYVDYWHSVADEGYLPPEYGNYGDWLTFEHQDETLENIGQPLELFNTASHYRATELVANAAGVLGYDDLEARYRNRAEAVAAAFNDHFFDDGAGRYEPEIQAAQAVPLFLGIVPDERTEDVAATLSELVEAAGTLQTGFLGTRALLAALTNHGHADLAYEVVSQPNQPGWVYMIDNGATTLWERWDSDEKVGSGMNSLNHSPFTMVSEWFYRELAGISPSMGDRRVAIRPAIVEDLTYVDATVETPMGPVRVAWEGGDELDVTARIPWNTTGVFEVPDGYDRLSVDGSVVWTDEDGVRGDAEAIGDIDDPMMADPDRTVALDPGEYTLSLT